MKITKLKKFNRTVLRKKTPLLGFTILELFILWVVISGGMAAVILTRHQSPTTVQDTSTSQPTYKPKTQATTPTQSTTRSSSENSATPSQPPATRPAATDDCKTTDIPYKTIYKDVSYLDAGQTQESGGHNGQSYYCQHWASPMTVDPVDKIVYVGTHEPSSSNGNASPQPTQNPVARQKCMSDYSSAKAQLAAAGALHSSALSRLNTLHQQCLRAAGY